MWRKSALAVVFSFVVALVGIPASSAIAAPPVFRVAATSNDNTVTPSVTVPASVQPGDQLVLIVTINTNNTIATPAGWTLLATEQDGSPDMTSAVFTRTADAVTATSTVITPLGARSKAAVTLVAYAGALPASGAVSNVAGAASTDLTTPSVSITDADSVVVSYWADKTSGNSGWTLPGSVAERATSIGTGGGRITAAVGDSSPPAGAWSGATASSTVAGAKGIAWTVVVPPAAGGGGGNPPVAAFTGSCALLVCSFDAGGSTDDGTIVSYAWDFGDGGSSTASAPSHTYAVAGDYDVTLTVTDDDGASTSITNTITASAPGVPSALEFRASASTNSNTTAPSVPVPGSVQIGDQLVLVVTANTATTIAAPPGWTQLGTDQDSSTTSSVFTRTADGGTAGSVATSTLGRRSKTAATLVAYVGALPPTGAVSGVAATTSLDLTTPGTTVGDGGSLVISYWSNKTSGNTGWTVPPAVTTRDTSIGTGNGRITAAIGDSIAPAGAWSGLTATSTVAANKAIAWTVVLPPADTNPVPVAAFTTSCSLLECTFDASGSSDDGTIVRYDWDFGDGTTVPDGGANPSHTYSAGGDVDVTLTVTDDGGASASVTDTVSPNAAPVAAFTSTCDDLACTFDAGGSTDDGTIVAYSWDFGDGDSATGSSAAHAYPAEDVYDVTLTVTDDDGATGSTTRAITVVITPNQDPVADFIATCTNLACTFDAGGSTDDGTIVRYDWDFGDGSTAPDGGDITAHTYGAEDTYDVTLTVTDDDGASGVTGTTTRTVVVVISPNQDPVAGFVASCVDLACTFDASSSTDDGAIVSYDWTFGDGSTAPDAGDHPSHTYATAGPYDVTLTVTDDMGASGVTGTTTQTITVVVVPNEPPVARFTPNCDGLVCTFDATDSTDDGTIVSYEWNFGDGDTATGATPPNNFPFPGSYLVSLTVTDDENATDQISISLPVSLPTVADITLPPDVPRTNTPRITDGEITDLAYIGNRVFVVGTFTSISNSTGNNTTTYAQPFLAAFNIDTGLVDANFRPSFGGGGVTEIAASPDGTKLFVVGRFNTVNGVSKQRVASINPTTGATITGFTANTNAAATAVAASNSTVYIGGQFSTMNGTTKVGLAAVDASTGALVTGFQNDISGGIGVNGMLTVQALVLTPDRSKLLVVHTGRQIAGQDRYGVGLIDTQTNQLLPWRTRLWDDNLSRVGGIQRIYAGAISPDGSYFVVTSGSGGDRPPISDTAVRYDIPAGGGTDFAEPVWISRMFDSVYSVAISDDAVFVGGHFNYQESPSSPEPWPGLDTVGYGRGQGLAGYGLGDDVVVRDHIGALDPATGKAVEWHPGSNSFEGNKSMLVMPRGVVTGGDAMIQGTVNVGRVAFYDLDDLPNVGPNMASIVFPIQGRVEQADAEFLVGGVADAATGVNRVQIEVYDMDSRQYLQDNLVSWGTWNGIDANLQSPGATTTVWTQPLTINGNRRIMFKVKTFGQSGSSAKVTKKIETFGLADQTPNTSISAPFGIIPTLTFTVTGTADDDFGVNAIRFSLRDGQNRYLQDDGTVDDVYNTFTGFPDVIGATEATWSYEVTVPYEDFWTMQAIAVDTAGQSDLRSSNRTWLVNASAVAPSVAITTPAVVNPPTVTAPITLAPGAPLTFTGSATDDEGLRNVEIRLRNRTTGENLASDGTWGVDAIRGWYRISPINLPGTSYNWSYTTPFDLTPGQYDFEVRATDDLDLSTSSSDRARLTVYAQVPGDAPPNGLLDVTGTQTGGQELQLTITGTATDDVGVAEVRVEVYENASRRFVQPDGTLSGAEVRLPAELATPNGTSTTWSLTVNLPEQGDYSVTAYAYDTVGQQDTSTSGATARYVIYPGDQPPQFVDGLFSPPEGTAFTEARIVVSGRVEDDQQIAQVQVAIRNAAGLYMNADGSFTTTNQLYRTAFLNSPGSPGSNFAYTSPPIPDGAYTVFARGVDQHGLVTPVPIERNVTVSGPVGNLPPVAAFTSDCTDNVCSFDARSSTDENATTLTYSWNFGNGSGSGPVPTRTYASAGTFTVTLTATDQYGLTGTVTHDVTITEPAGNVAPVPVINPPSCALLVCNFSSVGSADPDVGDTFTRLWDFGDGGTSGSTSPSHTFPAAGTYTVTLTVTDGWGNTATVTRDVTVAEV